MPRPAKKAKKGKAPAGEMSNGTAEPHQTATAIAEPPFEDVAPAAPAEPMPERRPAPAPEKARRPDEKPSSEPAPVDKDHIATSLNIAKLQSMSMGDLNHMARELGVENFGTMRKHEVIFHILQKNAERAGVLFSEG